MTRYAQLNAYMMHLRLTYRDSHNVDDRRELRDEMVKLREQIAAEISKTTIPKPPCPRCGRVGPHRDEWDRCPSIQV